jgi:hypothetical protein
LRNWADLLNSLKKGLADNAERRIDPRMVAVVRRFLKDNGIEAPATEHAGRDLRELSAISLPFL